MELAASAARRLALLVAVTAVGGTLFGDKMWQGSTWADTNPPTAYAILAVTLDYAKYALGAAAVLAFLGLRRGPRGGHDPRRLCQALSVGTIATLGVATVLGTIIYVSTVIMWPQALIWPPMIIGGVLLAAVGAWQMVAARHCIRATRALSGVRPVPAEPHPGIC